MFYEYYYNNYCGSIDCFVCSSTTETSVSVRRISKPRGPAAGFVASESEVQFPDTARR